MKRQEVKPLAALPKCAQYRGILILTACLFLIIPFANAGFLDLFKENPQFSPQNFSVTVGNAAPVVSISSINGGSNVDLIPASATPVEIIFDVSDNNGLGDLNEATLLIQYSSPGEATRSEDVSACSSVNSGNTRTYTCDVYMQHYDGAGTWTATVSIDDFGGPETGQDTLNFNVNQLRAITLSPETVNFPATSPGGNDYTPSSDTIVTNEGNYNIPSNGLGITAYDLCDAGCANTLGASNFNSGDGSLEPCTQGEILINNMPVSMPGFILSKGDAITPRPTRNIKHCLDVPGGTAQAIYSTINPPSQEWQFII